MKKKGVSALLGTICLIGLFLALSFATAKPGLAQVKESSIKLRCYYHASPVGGQAEFYKAWIKKVGEATKGRLEIVFYPGASLGPPMEAYKMIASGAVDMGCVIVGFYPGRFPLTDVVQLPFLGLPSAVVGSRVYWDLYERFPEFRKEYQDVKVLILYTDAPTPIGSNKAIRKAEDVKGLKIRALAGSPTEMIKALGGSPVLMPPGEIYTSMERKVIDGWMISWEAVIGHRLQEVSKYFTTANMYQPALTFLMNEGAWKKLPPDIQKIVEEHSGAAGAEFFGKEFDRFNKEGIEIVRKMKGKEIIPLSPEQVEKWRAICKPIWDKWVAEMEAKGLPGKAVLGEAQKLVAKYTKQYHP
ncbi:MAG: TRAP transporter substrate-binding protein [Syntrophaceae bacterium]|nr:TRAP transporter substrate-binding protein [Syntrophaceae bacterium]